MCRNRRSSEVADALREVCIDDPVAAEDAVHPHAVVEVVARDRVRDGVDVIVGVHAFNRKHLRSGKPLPVELDLLIEASELRTEEREKLDGVRSDEDVLFTILLKSDNRCREDVLERCIAVREPAYNNQQPPC